MNNKMEIMWYDEGTVRHRTTHTTFVPLYEELSILPKLLHWNEKANNKRKEIGMMKDQPGWRVNQIRTICDDKRNVMTLQQALSLRRLHIKANHPKHFTMERLRLGTFSDIKRSADLFEQAVHHYLSEQGCRFLTEEAQVQKFREHVQQYDETAQRKFKQPPTPDFLFSDDPIRIKSSNNNTQDASLVHWIEAKMFYGASTLCTDADTIVGSVVTKAEKYVSIYGPGAIIFAFGCGVRMKEELEKRSILVLDSAPLQLRFMIDHQRKWCTNKKKHGSQILP